MECGTLFNQQPYLWSCVFSLVNLWPSTLVANSDGSFFCALHVAVLFCILVLVELYRELSQVESCAFHYQEVTVISTCCKCNLCLLQA